MLCKKIEKYFQLMILINKTLNNMMNPIFKLFDDHPILKELHVKATYLKKSLIHEDIINENELFNVEIEESIMYYAQRISIIKNYDSLKNINFNDREFEFKQLSIDVLKIKLGIKLKERESMKGIVKKIKSFVSLNDALFEIVNIYFIDGIITMDDNNNFSIMDLLKNLSGNIKNYDGSETAFNKLIDLYIETTKNILKCKNYENQLRTRNFF